MKTYGYGTKVDYAEAMHWFDLAATSGDDRVSEDAFNNAQELNSLLQEAEAHNSAIQDSYRLRQEDGAELWEAVQGLFKILRSIHRLFLTHNTFYNIIFNSSWTFYNSLFYDVIYLIYYP